MQRKKLGLWRTDPNAKDLKPLFSTGAELHILIMNVEAFSSKKGVDFAKKFLSCHNTIIGIDESTTIKNPQAKRTRAIVELGTKSKYRRILTGSPVTKSPLDLLHNVISYILIYQVTNLIILLKLDMLLQNKLMYQEEQYKLLQVIETLENFQKN